MYVTKLLQLCTFSISAHHLLPNVVGSTGSLKSPAVAVTVAFAYQVFLGVFFLAMENLPVGKNC